MSAIDFNNHLKFSSSYGLAVTGVTALSIWGSHYVSILPKLPRSAGIVAGSITFIVVLAAPYVIESLYEDSSDGEARELLPLITVILGGSAFVTCGKILLSNKNVSWLKLAGLSLIENILGCIVTLACANMIDGN